MAGFISDSPYYYQTRRGSRPQATFQAAPNFGRGDSAGSIFDVANWLFEYHGKNSAVGGAEAAALSGDLRSQIVNELSQTGDTGFLFLVSRFKRPEDGALSPVIDGPKPIGSGASPAEALATNYILNGDATVSYLPEGFEYDDDNSFQIWVEFGEDGELSARTMPRPSATYIDAKRLIVGNIVKETSVISELDRRGRAYTANALALRDQGLDQRNQLALDSLLRTRENLAKSVERADRLWQAAGRAARQAENWSHLRSFFAASGVAISAFESSDSGGGTEAGSGEGSGDEGGSTPSSKGARETDRNTAVTNYINVETKIQVFIRQRMPDRELPEIDILRRLL